jgi:hypothetical protein
MVPRNGRGFLLFIAINHIVWLGINKCPQGTLFAPYLFNNPLMPMIILDTPTNNVKRFSNFRKNKKCSEGPPPYIYAKNLREDHC